VLAANKNVTVEITCTPKNEKKCLNDSQSFPKEVVTSFIFHWKSFNVYV